MTNLKSLFLGGSGYLRSYQFIAQLTNLENLTLENRYEINYADFKLPHLKTLSMYF